MCSMAMPTAPIIMLISLWYRKVYRSFGRFEGGISIFLRRRVSSGSMMAILPSEKGKLATGCHPCSVSIFSSISPECWGSYGSLATVRRIWGGSRKWSSMVWSEICLNHYGKDVLGKIVFSHLSQHAMCCLIGASLNNIRIPFCWLLRYVFVSWLSPLASI